MIRMSVPLLSKAEPPAEFLFRVPGLASKTDGGKTGCVRVLQNYFQVNETLSRLLSWIKIFKALHITFS
jgi:hypothetical protein